MFLIPIAGGQVPDPDLGGFLRPEGREVEPTQYWLRRINDGDVIETDPPAQDAPVAKKPAKPAQPE